MFIEMLSCEMYLCFSNLIMWNVLIRGCKPKVLHQFFIEFILCVYMDLHPFWTWNSPSQRLDKKN